MIICFLYNLHFFRSCRANLNLANIFLCSTVASYRCIGRFKCIKPGHIQVKCRVMLPWTTWVAPTNFICCHLKFVQESHFECRSLTKRGNIAYSSIAIFYDLMLFPLSNDISRNRVNHFFHTSFIAEYIKNQIQSLE